MCYPPRELFGGWLTALERQLVQPGLVDYIDVGVAAISLRNSEGILLVVVKCSDGFCGVAKFQYIAHVLYH